MLKKRIIPLLLLNEDRLIKTIKFDKYRDVGDPVSTAKIFSDSDADELIFLDVNKKKRSIEKLIKYLKDISENCFVPLSVGGGIRNIENAIQLIKSGADKIVLNSICYKNYSILKEISNRLGKQAVVASIDVKKENNKYILFSDDGRKKETISLEVHLKNLVENNVGEIMINSIDQEGTMSGVDLNLVSKVCSNVNVPVISTGGVGSYDHIKDIFFGSSSSAVACGSLFNFTDSNPIRVKSYLKNYNIPLRIY